MKKKTIITDEFGCINCGGVLFRFHFYGFDRLYGIPGKFQIIECDNCGLFAVRPRLSPGDVKPYYPENYFNFIKAVEDEEKIFRFIDRLYAREKRVHQIIKRTKGTGRILDVGCATGILLSGMQKRGWECYGVEPNQKAAEYARERFGLDVYEDYLENTAFPNDWFDVVTFMDVLEHIYDPVRTLNEVHRILKPEGVCIGTLPNANAWEKSFFGPYWIGWDVPRHYHIFTPVTIRQLLEANGFERVQIFSFTGRHGAFMLSVENWLGDWSGPRWLRSLINFTLGSLPARILMLPDYYISEQLNQSTIFSFAAQKGK